MLKLQGFTHAVRLKTSDLKAAEAILRYGLHRICRFEAGDALPNGSCYEGAGDVKRCVSMHFYGAGMRRYTLYTCRFS